MNETTVFEQHCALVAVLPMGVLLVDASRNPANPAVYINPMGWKLLDKPINGQILTRAILENVLSSKHFLLKAVEKADNVNRDADAYWRVPGFELVCHWVDAPKASPLTVITFTPKAHFDQECRLALETIKEELAQSKKMAAVGNTISNVVHELNNPLTGISMNSQLAHRTLLKLYQTFAQDETTCQQLRAVETALTHIEREACKTATLLNELRLFTKPAKLNLSLVNMEDLVNNIIGALKSHPEFQQLTFTVTPYVDGAQVSEDDVTTFCDRTKVEQVFYNLFKNTSDATNGQGTITIGFGPEIHEMTNEPLLAITVADNGPGIPSDILDRVFEPFFTTKGHVGTGLGLSISMATLEQHGGHLSVAHSSQAGTTFKITLPLFSDDD